MSNITLRTGSLAAIPPGGSITVYYPAGYTADMFDVDGTHEVVINKNDVYRSIADTISVSFFTNRAVVTNTSGSAWPAKSDYIVDLDLYDFSNEDVTRAVSNALTQIEDVAEETNAYAQAAATSADQAETARDVALSAAGSVYVSTSDGLAATSDGDLFLVIGSDGTYADLYLNDAGVAVAQGVSYPSHAAVTAATVTARGLEADRARLSNGAGAPPFVVGSARSPRRDTLRDRDAKAWEVRVNDRRRLLGANTTYDEIEADVPIISRGGVKLPEGISVTRLDEPSYTTVHGRHRVKANSGQTLIDLDADEPAVGLLATAAVPERKGGLWRRQSGVLVATPPADDLVIGMPRYQTIRYFPPRFPETPVIVWADQEEADGLDERLFQGVQAHCCVGDKTIYAWMGDNLHDEEHPGNFVVVAMRSGDVVTEIAYILHPNELAGTMYPIFMRDDDDVVHLFLTITGEPLIGEGSHDFHYSVWILPITGVRAGAPQFGQWRRPMPYGHVGGTAARYGTRWLLPLDCRETTNSPLYDANASDFGLIGKYLFEYIPKTGEFLQVNRWPAEIANNSWQESSVVFMRDGTYIHSWRTAVGPYIAVCPDGPEVPVSPGVPWTELDTDVETRHVLRMTPKGRLIAVYNAGPERINLTVKMWAPGKLPTLPADRTLLLSGALAVPDVSYPYVDFDESGNVVITCDNNRFQADGPRKILEWRLNEDNLFAGSISANPTPFVVNIQES